MIIIQIVPQLMPWFTESVEKIVPERNNSVETLRVIIFVSSGVSVVHCIPNLRCLIFTFCCKIIKIIDKL